MNVQQKADVGFPSLIQPQDMRSHLASWGNARGWHNCIRGAEFKNYDKINGLCKNRGCLTLNKMLVTRLENYCPLRDTQ